MVRSKERSISLLKVLFCLCLCLPLYPAEILLIQDFTQDPQDRAILSTPFFEKITQDLHQKNIQITPSALQEKKPANKEILGYLVWNRPSFLKRSDLKNLPSEKSILFIWEPPVIQKDLHSQRFWSHFKRIYTWDDALVDGRRFFKLYYPGLKPLKPGLPAFQERKLLTFIFSNKHSTHPDSLYAEREKMIHFFERQETDDFEFYGVGWDGKRYKNYRGAPLDKSAILKNFRFAICYENMQNVKGYITEKIFDCFETGTVPIYLGASNIEIHIPPGCFIDRRQFKTEDELYAYIKNVDENHYNQYLQNIEAFLKSEKGAFFTHTHFQKTLQEALDALLESSAMRAVKSPSKTPSS